MAHQRATHANAVSAPHPPPHPLLLSPPPFAHQVAGHGQPGGAGGFRAHRRQRSNGCVVAIASSASGHIDAAVSTAADAASAASASHQPTVLKPVPLHKDKGAREQQFYQHLDHMRRQVQGRDGADHTSARVCWCALSESADPPNSSAVRDSQSRQQLRHLDAMRSWLTFFPRFYGTLALSEPSVDSPDGALSHYLHLEDVTQPYAHPSLLDVKIGTHSWDPFAVAQGSAADIEKVRREIAKCPAQSTTNFRICGARVWKPTGLTHTSHSSNKPSGEYECYGKHWARDVSVDDVEQPFWTFFGHSQSNASQAPFAPSQPALRSAALILPVYIARLRRLLHLCQTAPLWRFYASSILFSYQLHDEVQQQQQEQPQPSGAVAAAVDAASHGGSVFPVAGRAELHVIDFGHAYPIELPLPANLDSLLLDDAHSARGKHHGVSAPAVGDASCVCGLPAATLDANYIAGVTSLIQIFERMLERTRAQNLQL